MSEALKVALETLLGALFSDDESIQTQSKVTRKSKDFLDEC
tara:strand:+ start:2179 stop:2301 length:123 start_codon:yes stop_codon:yes gene_type:complete